MLDLPPLSMVDMAIVDFPMVQYIRCTFYSPTKTKYFCSLVENEVTVCFFSFILGKFFARQAKRANATLISRIVSRKWECVWYEHTAYLGAWKHSRTF